MTRLAGALLAIALMGACQSSDETDALRARLDRALTEVEQTEAAARERVRDLLERLELADRPPDADRYVDLYNGGPAVGGVVLALPPIGVLKYRCDYAGRHRIDWKAMGASVDVSYETSEGDSGRRSLHGGKRLSAFVGEGETVTWSVAYRHKPGSIRATVSAQPDRSRHGRCYVPKVRLGERTRTFD